MRVEKWEHRASKKYPTVETDIGDGARLILVLDNGVRLEIAEVRESASLCSIEIRHTSQLSIIPRVSNVVMVRPS